MPKQTISTFRSPVLIATALLFAASFNGVTVSPYAFAAWFLLIAMWLGMNIWNARIVDGISWPTGWLPAALVAYLIWIGLNPYFSVLPQTSWLQGIIFSALPLVFIAWFGEHSETPDQRWKHVSFSIRACGVILSLWGISLHLMDGERAHGPLIDANAYAALINLCLIPLIYEFLQTPRTSPAPSKSEVILTFGGISLMVTANLLAFSRGGLLALLIGIAVASAFLLRGRNLHVRRLLILLVVLVATYSVTRYLSDNPSGDMIARDLKTITLITGPQKLAATDSAWHERMLLWSSAMKMVQDGNIFHGYGLGTFKTIFPPYRHPNDGSAGNYAHNDYLQAAAEGGIIQLTFLTSITVIAPLWLLSQIQRRRKHAKNAGETNDLDSSGFALAVLCTSLHASVNFIYAILPISMLVGLYLARCWETTHTQHRFAFPSSILRKVRPSVIRAAGLVLVFLPVSALVADTFVSIAITGNGDGDALIWKVPSERQLPLIGGLIAIRPNHPLLHEIMALHFIASAEAKTDADQSTREQFLALAEQEINAVARLSAVGPSWPLLKAKVHMARGTQMDLNAASSYLFEAQRWAPHNVLVRRELVRCLGRMGLDKRAFEIAQEHRQWLLLTTSLAMLAELSDEALPLARRYGDNSDVQYWTIVRSHLLSYLPKHVQ